MNMVIYQGREPFVLYVTENGYARLVLDIDDPRRDIIVTEKHPVTIELNDSGEIVIERIPPREERV